MSASGSRAYADINLEEFERRLRAAGAPQTVAEDPLVELARLVEPTTAPRAPAPPAPAAPRPAPPVAVAAPAAAPTAAPPPRPAAPPVPPAAPRQAAPAPAPRPPAPAPAPARAAPPPSPPPPVEEAHAAELRSSFDETGAEGVDTEDHAYEVEPPPEDDGAELYEEEMRRARSGNRKLAVSVLGLVGVLALTAVVVSKGRVPGLPRTPPFIEASQSPTKVQPPSQETVASTAADSTALLMKDGGAKPGPVKVVNSEEQPVDLAAKPPAPSAAPPVTEPTAPATVAATPIAASPIAASPIAASPVAESANPPLVAPSPPIGAAAPPAIAPLFPDPKPVRTVSLRPDGTLISAAPSAADIAEAPPLKGLPKPIAKATDDPNADAQAATPKIDLPAKPSAKSAARVPIAKTDTTVPAGAATETPNTAAPAGALPTKLEKAAKKHAKTDAVPTPPPAPVPAPAQEAAPAPAAPSLIEAIKNLTTPKPAQVATAAPAAAAPAPAAEAPVGGGAWAVQLAAPRSDSEAQGAVSRLKSKYSGALGGAELAIVKASVNGETIYRVRAVGMSKSDASALCGKIKADGGDCFVAK